MVNARELRRIGQLSAADTIWDGGALTPDAGASNLETDARRSGQGCVTLTAYAGQCGMSRAAWAHFAPYWSTAHAPPHNEPKVPAIQAPAAPVELRVGMPVWTAVELDDVRDSLGSLRFGNRKHDVGFVVGLPSGLEATVVFKHAFASYSGFKVEWATHADRRRRVERSLLLAANPTIPPRTGPSELYKVVRNLKSKQPNLTAKQVHEQICALAPLPEPATLAAVKRCLKLLQQHKCCPFLALLPPDAFTLIADEMPLAALLNVSATCSDAREVLTHTRLERSKVAVEANDRRNLHQCLFGLHGC